MISFLLEKTSILYLHLYIYNNLYFIVRFVSIFSFNTFFQY